MPMFEPAISKLPPPLRSLCVWRVARAAQLAALAVVAAAPWIAATLPADLPMAPIARAADKSDFRPIIFPKPPEVEEAERKRWADHPPEREALMTPVTPADRLMWAAEERRERLARQKAMENAQIAGSISEWVSDGRSMRPLFSAAGLAPFAASLSNAADMGRLTQLRRSMADHARGKPEGWEALVERAKSEWSRGGDMALLRAVDSMINDVPYVDGTDGTFFSPKRFLSRGGVCKDFAAAKYILLREAGFPAERIRVAVLTPRNPGGEWHVVVLALPEGAKDPLVLDILPFPVAAKSLARSGMTIGAKVARLNAHGIDPDSVDYDTSPMSLIPLSRYGTKRSIDWVGNEFGGAAFAKGLPSMPDPGAGSAQFAAGSVNSSAGIGGGWVGTDGVAPFSVLSLRRAPIVRASAR